MISPPIHKAEYEWWSSDENRSLKDVARYFGKSLSSIKRWSTTEDWADYYDQQHTTPEPENKTINEARANLLEYHDQSAMYQGDVNDIIRGLLLQAKSGNFKNVKDLKLLLDARRQMKEEASSATDDLIKKFGSKSIDQLKREKGRLNEDFDKLYAELEREV